MPTATSPVTEQLPGVLREVTEERARQIAKGYTPEHDDQHSTAQLIRLAAQRAGVRGAEVIGGPATPVELRSNLVEAAAMLIAAVEAMDRRA